MAKLKQPPLAGTVWLADRCTETYTVRLTGVSSNPALLDDLKLPMDCKEILVHYEGSDVMGYYKGTITGSTTVYLTTDGMSLVLPICANVPDKTDYGPTPDGVNLTAVLGHYGMPANKSGNISIIANR